MSQACTLLPRKSSWITVLLWFLESASWYIFFPRRRRQANLLKGKQLLREGKVSEARECFTRSVNITHVMAHKVIKVSQMGKPCNMAKFIKTNYESFTDGRVKKRREGDDSRPNFQGSASLRRKRVASFNRAKKSNSLQGRNPKDQGMPSLLGIWARWAPSSVEREGMVLGGPASRRCHVVVNISHLHCWWLWDLSDQPRWLRTSQTPSLLSLLLHGSFLLPYIFPQPAAPARRSPASGLCSDGLVNMGK